MISRSALAVIAPVKFPQRFDFAEITCDVAEACKKDLALLYDQGVVKKEVLRHQTQDILFSESSPVWGEHWQMLRQSFIDSVSEFMNRHFSVKAWCFASFPKIKNLQWDWHEHPNAEFSALMYLSLPKDNKDNTCFTTEFLMPDGKSLFLEPKLWSWFVFPGAAVHRNGFWDHESMSDTRYCIAASALK